MTDTSMSYKLFGQDVSASKALKDVSKQSEKTGKDIGSHIHAGTIAAGAAIGTFLSGGVSSLIGGFGDLVKQARESEAAGRITAQVIKTTGGAAHITADQVDDLATAISNKTGVDDDAIKSSANMLLTFTDVRNEVGKGNDIFNQATQMVTDMSVALGQDGKASAIQLGKALNDPIKGVTALSKVGVSFTDQQKKQIKTLMEHGKTLDAQKVILKELGREFGGAAAASSDPMQKLQVTVGNLAKGLAQQLLPYIEKGAVWLSKNLMPALQNLIPIVAKFADWIGKNAGVLGPLVGIVLAVIAAIRIWIGVQAAINAVMALNPIGLVVAAIIALIAIVVLAYNHFDWFHNLVDTVWAGIKTAVSAVVQWFTTTAWPKIKAFIAVLVAGFKLWWGAVSSVVGWIIGKVGSLVSWFVATAWPKIHGVITLLVAGFQFWWQKARDVIGWIIGRGESLLTWFTGLKDKVGGVLSGFWQPLADGFRTVLNAIKTVWNNTIGGKSFHLPGIPGTPFQGVDLDIPRLAQGALIQHRPGGILANIGEGRYDEAVIPLDGRHGIAGTVENHYHTHIGEYGRVIFIGTNKAQAARDLADLQAAGGRGGFTR